MKRQIVRLALGLSVIILFSITCTALFYPDFSGNDNEYYFKATVQLQLCDKDQKELQSVENILIKECMNSTIEEMNIYMISRALKNINYDTKVNYNEATDSIMTNIDKRKLNIIITSHDSQYASEMAKEISNQLVTENHWGAPNFYFKISKPVEIKRHLTLETFFNRQIGEEITVAFFTVVWICVLGIILMGEIKKGKIKNAAN